MSPGRRLLLRLAALATIAGIAAALGFGYLGALHGAFDAFSHFRIHLAVIAAAGAALLLALRLRREAAMAALLAGATLATTLLPWGMPGTQQASAPPADTANGREAVFRLLQLNLRFDNAAPERALSLIGGVRPDVITLNEVSAMWEKRLEVLEAAYPYRIVCPRPAPIGGAAILSRRPFAPGIEPACHDRGSLATARIDFAGRQADVVALHMGWPWPFEQPWQIPNLVGALGGIGNTAVLAGDMNAVPWSHSARRVAEAGGLRILRGIGATWLVGGAPDWLRRVAGLPIDNVMVKGGVVPLSLTRMPGVGSDHLPVLLEFAVLPEEQPSGILQARLD